MHYTGNKIRSASLTGSGTVRSGNLRGIDSTVAEDERSLSRADGLSFYDGGEKPGAVNMIRTGLGQVTKRPGYKLCGKAAGLDTIGGVFTYSAPDTELYFFVSGNSLAVSGGAYGFDEPDAQIISLPDNFDNCTAMQCEENMFFMNGNFMFIYRVPDGRTFYIGSDGSSGVTEFTNPFDGLYLPLIFIGCTPAGAGASYEAVNLLNPYVSEQFIADGTSNVFTVHMDIRPNSTVHAFIKNSSGAWESAAVYAASGKSVSFTIPPAKTAIEGEDNVKIIYMYNAFSDTAYKLAKCRCLTMYGAAGYKDRIFLAGNDRAPNIVYYSEMDNLLYFPDLNYLKIGESDTEVVALAGDDTRLAVICNDNVYMVSGNVRSYDTEVDFIPSALFLISGIFKTPRPAPYVRTQAFDNEVIYLTEMGVAAITASGVLDERCCQIRSAMINYHLLKENLSECFMLPFGDFLIISNRNDTLYLLDSKQYSKSGSEPFSYRQYDGYIWKNIKAKYMWVQDGKLCFSDGRYVFCFNQSSASNNDYRDETDIADGELVYSTINAYWETPAVCCQSFHVNKFFDRMGVLLAGDMAQDGALINTDVKISAKFDNDDWRVIKDYGGELSIFRYGNISYGKFTYSDRPKSYAVYKRLLHKRGKSIKLRFENDNFDQPFTMQSFLIEYSIM